jgi:SOS regulatory protein LexA
MEHYKNQIISFYHQHRRMPGYQEIMVLTGFKSKNAVYKLINKLVEAGVVAKDAQGKMTPSRSFSEVPVLGLVEAGIPSVAEVDTSASTMSLDDYLIDHKHQAATYILEVKGDSMIEAGINEGDLVIVERQEHAKEGDIVIAEVDGGWTMKYFRTKRGQAYLQPANKNYRPIYPTQDFRIAAIVRGVVRKY